MVLPIRQAATGTDREVQGRSFGMSKYDELPDIEQHANGDYVHLHTDDTPRRRSLIRLLGVCRCTFGHVRSLSSLPRRQAPHETEPPKQDNPTGCRKDRSHGLRHLSSQPLQLAQWLVPVAFRRHPGSLARNDLWLSSFAWTLCSSSCTGGRTSPSALPMAER
jgi:hypothetical protein